MHDSRPGKGLAILYSIANGASAAVTMGSPLYDDIEDKSLALGAALTTGALAFSAEAFACYTFQGKSIQHLDDEDEDPELGSQYGTNLAHVTSSIQSNPAPVDDSCCTVESCWHPSALAQLCYTVFLDAGKNLADRYYFLKELREDDNFLSDPVWFWGILVLGFSFKQLFAMTNGTFEANEHIDKKIFARNGTPFYNNCFQKYFSGYKTRKFISIMGSLDHTISDDVVPMVSLFDEILNQLPLVSVSKMTLFIIFSIFPGSLVFIQTLLYEGIETEKNLTKPGEAIDHIDNYKRAPNCLISAFTCMLPGIAKSLPIMGPVHGFTIAAPVFLSLNKAKNEFVKYALAPVCGVFSFYSTHRGIIESEVRIGKIKLERLYRDLCTSTRLLLN